MSAKTISPPVVHRIPCPVSPAPDQSEVAAFTTAAERAADSPLAFATVPDGDGTRTLFVVTVE